MVLYHEPHLLTIDCNDCINFVLTENNKVRISEITGLPIEKTTEEKQNTIKYKCSTCKKKALRCLSDLDVMIFNSYFKRLILKDVYRMPDFNRAYEYDTNIEMIIKEVLTYDG